MANKPSNLSCVFLGAALAAAVVYWLQHQHDGLLANLEAKSQAVAAPTRQQVDRDGNSLVSQAAAHLERLPTLSAKVRQRVDIFGQQLNGAGTYVQMADDGPVPLSRLELKLQTREGTATCQQVCDGKKLWIYQKVTSPIQSCVDVALVLAAQVQQSTSGRLPDALGVGGLPELLSSLARRMRFTRVDAGTLGEMDVWILRGQWASPPDVDWAKRLHLPTHVLLYLGQRDLFPYRIDYCRDDRDDDQPLVRLEFYEVRQKVRLDEKLFVYRPSRRTVADSTAEYLRDRGLNLPSRPPDSQP